MTETAPPSRNRLANALSPYLAEHAEDPVNWYPWGPEALADARALNRPILLSIGYTACHWCHVMAEESFRDPATAEILNAEFVCIKVDREERPDIDRIYQSAQQLLTQRGGGWPLTMFLAPQEAQPFFGGTYFPPDERYGVPGFKALLKTAADFYRDNADRAVRQGDALRETLAELSLPEPAARLAAPGELTKLAQDALKTRFDSDTGGFSGAPKFPNTPLWLGAMALWRFTADGDKPDVNTLFQAAKTAEHLCNGGVFDHLAGGFFRYAVDADWELPHFEKMLGENALLIEWLAQLFGASGESLYSDTIDACVDWLKSTMRADSGGFFSSTSADLCGIEGGFYLLTKDDLADIAALPGGQQFIRWYSLDAPLAEAADGRHLRKAANAVPAEKPRRKDLKKIQSVLFESRRRRAPAGAPHDNKILTSANALAVCALNAWARLGDSETAEAMAQATMKHLRDRHGAPDAIKSYTLGTRNGPPGFLDDYAALLLAALSTLETRYNDDLLDYAIELAETLVSRFFDPACGLFNLTEACHETPLGPSRPISDDAMPAGNSLAVRGLTRLGFLIGKHSYLDVSAKVIETTASAFEQAPHQHMSLLTAALEHRLGTEVVVIRGAPEEARSWAAALSRMPAPHRLIVTLPNDSPVRHDAFAAKFSTEKAVSAMLCRGMACERPVLSFDALSQALKDSGLHYASELADSA